MEPILKILNSPFGLLVAGAIVSGIFVQYTASRWQHANWLQQQDFTARKAAFERSLEKKYQVLEKANDALAAILTHSQFVVAGYAKRVPAAQLNQLVAAYNTAVMTWETEFRTHQLRIKAAYSSKKPAEIWDLIKRDRDNLDLAIYELGRTDEASFNESLNLISGISDTAAELSQAMMLEINSMSFDLKP